MLANIYERLWPVPVKEIPDFIFTLRKYVATDYAALLRLFKKVRITNLLQRSIKLCKVKKQRDVKRHTKFVHGLYYKPYTIRNCAQYVVGLLLGCTHYISYLKKNKSFFLNNFYIFYFQRQFRISSTIYSRFGNITKPNTFKQLLTQVISLDMHQNRTDFRESILEILERGTKGHLEHEMLPKKDPAWREIFDNTTHGVYVNTLHYKSEWDKPWTNIGDKRFFDNSMVPFIELQGEYPYAETDNASAVIINLQVRSHSSILIF